MGNFCSLPLAVFDYVFVINFNLSLNGPKTKRKHLQVPIVGISILLVLSKLTETIVDFQNAYKEGHSTPTEPMG